MSVAKRSPYTTFTLDQSRIEATLRRNQRPSNVKLNISHDVNESLHDTAQIGYRDNRDERSPETPIFHVISTSGFVSDPCAPFYDPRHKR